ncbi:hypothetical protein H1164_17115 [Thermoactinomyces daqus]|uniref:Uncharacterized protein n=1 Tax=Thermoactinomyces daqus TaxID=1329516 RepID=A0A7W1XDH4_9BACL|nr:hypothetical protein [Thermoactinomyces daqus]MBA4544552.1 hypothetical protein [Thermoactinomyces daqus]
MDLNKMLQQILNGQIEIKDRLTNIEGRLDKIETRLDRIEKNQTDEVKVLHTKIRRVEKVFNEELLKTINE